MAGSTTTQDGKRERRDKPFRKKRFLAWRVPLIALLAIAAVVVNVLAFGQFRTVLDNYFQPKLERSEATGKNSDQLGRDIEAEGAVLLRNENAALPLDSAHRRVNVFGWSSTNPIYGGTGSGAVDTSRATSLLDGLENAGIEYNSEITDFYKGFREDRPAVEIRAQDWTVPEPSMAEYDEAGIFESAKEYSDTAIVVVSRSGGEGADLATSLGGKQGSIEEKELPDGRVVSVGVVGSEYDDDVAADKHYLELSNRERTTLERVSSEFENVIVLVNTGNVFEMGFVEEYDVDAAMWIGGPGETGFDSVGRLLTGELNPSGRTVDTWTRDLLADPTLANFGKFTFTGSENADPGAYPIAYSGDPNTAPGFQFLQYAEGIYTGYRYYETAFGTKPDEYAARVQYPFGYGLSYTSFEQKLDSVSRAGGKTTATVTVTNTGSVKGKTAVQLYLEPPYTEGGIEKASKNLVAFDKSSELAPGQSETLQLVFEDEDIASFDQNGAQAYVLEQGDYTVHLGTDAHESAATGTFTVDATITYGQGSPRPSDLVPATPRFADAKGPLTVLSRAGDFANYDQAIVPATDREMTPEEIAAVKVDKIEVPDAKMPTTGADNGLTLADLRDAEYDDPRWDQLLDQMSTEEMRELISMGGYRTAAVPSIDKAATVDIDGPAGLSSFMGSSRQGGAFPVAMVLASTFNTDLAEARGKQVGLEALEMGVQGWYAPGANMHRSPFGGRNFEYYGEDPVLTGKVVAGETRGAEEQGLTVYLKHFAMNDQEAFRNSRLTTWADEQTIREIYLKPFEEAVKNGDASAVMSSYTYVGGTWAGADPRLLNDVLRSEWGFHGMVLTDYFGDYGYMNANWAIQGGGSIMLSTLGSFGATPEGDDPSTVQQMRTASKDILFTVAHSSAMYSDDEKTEKLAATGGQMAEVSGLDSLAASLGIPTWVMVAYVLDALIALLIAWLIWRTTRTFKRRSAAA